MKDQIIKKLVEAGIEVRDGKIQLKDLGRALIVAEGPHWSDPYQTSEKEDMERWEKMTDEELEIEYELAHEPAPFTETTMAHEKWFNSLSTEAKKMYLQAVPKSKYSLEAAISKEFSGLVNKVYYMFKVNGVDAESLTSNLPEQLEQLRKLKNFKSNSSHDYIRAKGKDPKAAVKEWVKEFKPTQYLVSWNDGDKDDSLDVYYVGHNTFSGYKMFNSMDSYLEMLEKEGFTKDDLKKEESFIKKSFDMDVNIIELTKSLEKRLNKKVTAKTVVPKTVVSSPTGKEGKLVKEVEIDGKKYQIFFRGISYSCPELNIFGERTELTCVNSIKKKLKKAK